MPDPLTITQHYSHGSLVDVIREGVLKLGKTPDTLSVDDLAPVDEFHIGGRVATEAFLDQLDIHKDHMVLDVGCGLGGSSRFVAERYGCHITGVDLTPDYIDTGNVLCDWVGLANRIDLKVGDATDLRVMDGHFDRAWVMHVGMNIADKAALAKEMFRVLRPGGRLGIYDVMQVDEGELAYPVPWASDASGSAVAAPEVYRDALQAAGFTLLAERNRRDFAVEFFEQLRAKVAAAGGPPPLGLHLLMGESAVVKVKNMVDNIANNRVAPVELIAEKPA